MACSVMVIGKLGQVASGTTDAAGHIRLESVLPGEHVVEVQPEGTNLRVRLPGSLRLDPAQVLQATLDLSFVERTLEFYGRDGQLLREFSPSGIAASARVGRL